MTDHITANLNSCQDCKWYELQRELEEAPVEICRNFDSLIFSDEPNDCPEFVERI